MGWNTWEGISSDTRFVMIERAFLDHLDDGCGILSVQHSLLETMQASSDGSNDQKCILFFTSIHRKSDNKHRGG
jgi:hypothetical protein